jgi:hypothetical protein
MLILFKQFAKLHQYQIPPILLQIVIIVSCLATCANYKRNSDRASIPNQITSTQNLCNNEKPNTSLSVNNLTNPLPSGIANANNDDR